MNPKRIYQLANLSSAVYRIAYTTMLLYWLARTRRPQQTPEPSRRYH